MAFEIPVPEGSPQLRNGEVDIDDFETGDKVCEFRLLLFSLHTRVQFRHADDGDQLPFPAFFDETYGRCNPPAGSRSARPYPAVEFYPPITSDPTRGEFQKNRADRRGLSTSLLRLVSAGLDGVRGIDQSSGL